MTHTIDGEMQRVSRNILWTNSALLLAAAALAAVPMIISQKFSFNPDFLWVWIIAGVMAGLAVFNLYRLYGQKNGNANILPGSGAKPMAFGAKTAVDADLAQANDFLSFTLGRAWLLKRAFFSFELASLQDIVWVYERTSYAEYMMYSQNMVWLRSGKCMPGTLTANSKSNDAFQESLSKNAPWVIIGDSPALQKLWKKDRNNFIAQVDQRKQVLGNKK